jgi:hypothetical protein
MLHLGQKIYDLMLEWSIQTPGKLIQDKELRV